MNILLIIREELICLIILLFLQSCSRYYDIGKEKADFNRLWFWAVAHVVLDMVTVWTVNHTESVPLWVNWGLHVCFYLSAIGFVSEFLCYILSLVYDHRTVRRARIFTLLLAGGCLTALFFVPMDFLQGNGTKYSYGMAAFIGYAVAFIILLMSLITVIRNFRRLEVHVRRTIVPMLSVMLVAEVIQILVPELLFTGADLTIVTVGVFFALENPTLVLQRKAMMDTLTGVKSRNAYEMDIRQLERDYQEKRIRADSVGLVFCDINGLKQVNDTFGHLSGDEYIGTVAGIIAGKMVSVKSVYRMGGDEFLAVYQDTPEPVIRQEIKAVQEECSRLSKGAPYRIALAMGFEMSGPAYAGLKQVLREADRKMYQNKWILKKGERMKNRLVIFDLDGTILDTLEDLKESTNAALGAQGYPARTTEEVRNFVGNGIRRLIEQAVPSGTSPEQISITLDAFKAHYKEHCADHTKPYDGIVPLLDRLKRDGILTAVVSNKADFAVQELCREYFPDVFDFVVGEREGIRRKPYPDSVFEVLRTLQVTADEAVYVGDSDVDIETARQAGMDSILVSWGFKGRAFLEAHGAVQIVDTPEEIDGLLK